MHLSSGGSGGSGCHTAATAGARVSSNFFCGFSCCRRRLSLLPPPRLSALCSRCCRRPAPVACCSYQASSAASPAPAPAIAPAPALYSMHTTGLLFAATITTDTAITDMGLQLLQEQLPKLLLV